MQVIIFGALAVVSLLVFTSTVFGRHLYAAGANPTAARLSGVNVDRIRIGTYLICGLLCGMAGLIRSSDLGHASREGATVVTQGPGLLDSMEPFSSAARLSPVELGPYRELWPDR